MKKKGFTLVKLLVVIVILAVIALITVPIIGNIIEDSKKKAWEQSVYRLVEAANYFIISNNGVYEFLFEEGKRGETTNTNVSTNTTNIVSLQTAVDELTSTVTSNTSDIQNLESQVANHFVTYYMQPAFSEIIDCNDLPINSVGYTYSTTTNSPTGGAGYIVFTYGMANNTFRVQLAISIGSGNLYTRGYHDDAGTWSAWSEK